jgi:hypothetical protein
MRNAMPLPQESSLSSKGESAARHGTFFAAMDGDLAAEQREDTTIFAS